MVKINLFRMRQLMRQVPRKLWQIEQERAKATKITTVLTGMPRASGNHSQVEDGAIKLSELEAAYREVLDELETMRKALDPLISTIENADLRAAMRLRYIDGHRPETIADAIPLADRTVYRYLKRGENELCQRYPDQVRHDNLFGLK